LVRTISNVLVMEIESNNSGTAKVKIVKNERDPPLFTGKLLIKFQKILRNTTQVIVRHRICLQMDGHGETSIPPTTSLRGFLPYVV
jgi:hypothetical protein